MSARPPKYLNGYPAELQQQALTLLQENKIGELLRKRHRAAHTLSSANALYEYTLNIKNTFLRSSPPISKVIYDDKIHVINQALGLHTFVSRVQGNKLKAKKEIRISTLFRNTPEAFLRMIVVHELAHLREKEHNKAFYKLCQHMEPSYHQLEFEVRLYLYHREQYGDLW